MRAAMLPAKLFSLSSMRYFSISSELLRTVVVMPRKVRLTLSPSFLALTPNSFSLSNSPVLASATASMSIMRSLPSAADMSP